MRSNRRGVLVALAALAVSWGEARGQFPSRPEAARIVTDDVRRFWEAFDRREDLGGEVAFQRLYLDRGSPGLVDFVRDRIRSAAALEGAVAAYEPFYASIRAQTLRVGELEAPIRASLAGLEQLYPESVFPPVFFVIGRVNTAGHATESGLIIGTELFSTTPDTRLDVLEPQLREVIRSLSFTDLPYVAVHELVHFQQGEPEMAGRNLLGQVLYEGVAEFVTDLVTGDLVSPNVATYRFGDDHAEEIWSQFESDMLEKDFSHWLYNQGQGTDEWPADVGYYVGYEIAEAYYRRSPDPSSAIRDMLQIDDPEAFLARSGYGETFGP